MSQCMAKPTKCHVRPKKTQILVFAGRTGYFVGFVELRLIWGKIMLQKTLSPIYVQKKKNKHYYLDFWLNGSLKSWIFHISYPPSALQGSVKKFVLIFVNTIEYLSFRSKSMCLRYNVVLINKISGITKFLQYLFRLFVKSVINRFGFAKSW